MATYNTPDWMGAVFARVRHIAYLLLERVEDWRFGVTTEGDIPLHELGIQDSDCHCYGATGYRRFAGIMERIAIVPGEDGFIDFGSGLGRVVMLAAQYPFKHVLGVEVSEQLHERAVKNINSAKASFKCQDVQLLNVDARSFSIPDSATVFYFWNPFSENILRVVCEALRASLERAPRKITICYASPYEPNCMENLLPEFPWLARRETFKLGSRMRVTIADSHPVTPPPTD